MMQIPTSFLAMALTCLLLMAPCVSVVADGQDASQASVTTQETATTKDPSTDGSDSVTSRVLRKLESRGIVVKEATDDAVIQYPPPSYTGAPDLPYGMRTDPMINNSLTVIPLVALTLFFLTPVLIIALLSFNHYRRGKLLHDNINQLIEQGKDIPPQLYDLYEGSPGGDRSLRRGITLVAVGVGMFASLTMLANVNVGSLGLIPFSLGIAYLIIWSITGPKLGG